MREKKSMKKISDEGVREMARKKNRKKNMEEVAAKIPDSDLFAVNVDKDGLHQKRDKLAADRFKRKNTEGNLKSKTEVTLLKRLQAKNPAVPVEKEKEVFDLWGSNTPKETASITGPSKKVQKFKEFTSKSVTKIKPVMNPHGG